MTEAYNNLTICLEQIRRKTNIIPELAIVFGSGLNKYSEYIDIECTIDYQDLNNFPVTTNEMHKGRFIFGYVHQKPIVAMDGRIHYYEGYTMEQVVMPIRLMKMLGAKTLILSNAVGGIRKDLNVGDFMIINDHISSLVPSPLIGENIYELGTRFPDMSHVYNKELNDIIKQCAKELNIEIKEGVYLQTTGPNYETPAEIRAYQTLGADAVGMSTACEAMTAVHCGFKVCGISCITNKASGMSDEPLSDEDVAIAAAKSSDNFCKLIKSLIKSI
ncbi:MAG: purine-nucleoside phosphorylase [Eubacterium sp.]|nr:purine-nucleoside phosphorylase [Eubacterium sp.]